MNDEPTTLLLNDFNAHGTTRARHRGRWMEVEHGIPGETVTVEVLGQKRQIGRIIDLVEAAPDRAFPPCEYYREWKCGGCQWQHITYPGQLRRKRALVKDSMRRAGLDLKVTSTHSLNDPWRYRSTAGISLGKAAGFRRHGSLAIVPIRDCLISHPLIGQLMAALNDRIAAGTLPDFRGRVRLDVRLGEWPEGERLQMLVRPDEQKPPDPGDVAILLSQLGTLTETGGVSLLQSDGTVEIVSGDRFTTVTVAGKPVSLTAGSFFQTNLELLPQLIARLQQEAAPLEGKHIADLYAGVGLFGLFLAQGAAQVTMIESDPLAVEAGRRTAELWGASNVRVIEADVDEGLDPDHHYDVVIVDPPRTGLDDEVRRTLTATQPPLILYVSCLPQSLARDLVELVAAGYHVEYLELFDFYPQTYHVELLAVLRLQV